MYVTDDGITGSRPVYRISALNTRGLESKNAGFLVGYHLREVNIQGRSQLQFFS